MTNGYYKVSLVLSLVLILALPLWAADLTQLEEQGIELTNDISSGSAAMPDAPPSILLDSLPDFDVLLIPNSTADDIGIYDPANGNLIGTFLTDTTHFSTPICAIPGPDGKIYVSDQVADAVFVYDREGNYISTYADGTDGLNNIRGIDFRNDTLFVTSGDDYVARFAGEHNRLSDFINDGTDSFDIYFLPDGRALLADIQGTTDNIRLYNADGSFVMELFSVNFPEQIQIDLVAPGDYLNTSFSAALITDFELNGSIISTVPWSSGRGVYRLGNGNLLATNGNGVFEIDPVTGAIIEQKATGSGRFIELVSTGAGPPPSGCQYVPGDVNNSTSYNGLDITYSVAYLKGGPAPPYECECTPGNTWFVAGDVNNSCTFNGLDITYGVAYFKGGAGPIPCADCLPQP